MKSAIFFLTLLVGACSGSTGVPVVGDPCTVNRPYAIISPDSAVVAVGDTLSFHATLGPDLTCAPPGLTVARFRWSAQDTTVAEVGLLNGHFLGRAPGATYLGVFDVVTGRDLGFVRVSVH
ncbi:MAG TPA: hypothetical protein VFI39_01130 [Gemmatimonadales bacterium]|nr:hypothetical protein [Gemmatimonadales bacterium]